MARRRSILGIIVSRLVGLIILILILCLISLLVLFLYEPAFGYVVDFLNANLAIIILMTLFFLIADIFRVLGFPFNLPYPLFNAIASIFVVMFMFNIFTLVDWIIGENLFHQLRGLSPIIYPLVFILVLLLGYIAIFSRIPRRDHEETQIRVTEKTKKDEEKRKKGKKSWDDVSDEFRSMMYDAFHNMRKSEKKKEAKKYKKKPKKKKSKKKKEKKYN